MAEKKPQVKQIVRQVVKLFAHDQGSVHLGMMRLANYAERKETKAGVILANRERIEGYPEKINEDSYTLIKVLQLEQDLPKMPNHPRMKVFLNKGTKCANPNCNRVGTRLIVGMDKTGKQHVDIYTDNFYLMTVDHIIPKSKGGTNELSNLQPMCFGCNVRKGSKIIG